MNATAISQADVEKAADWVRQLVQAECRCPGDYDNAMRRIETSTGLAYSVMWALHYRKPKALMTGVFTYIKQVYDAKCLQQARRVTQSIEIAEAAGHDLDPDLIRAAQDLARRIEKHCRKAA